MNGLEKNGLHEEHLAIFQQEIKTLMANKSDDKYKEIKELKKQLAKKGQRIKTKRSCPSRTCSNHDSKKKVGLYGRRFDRESLTTESERQTILDFIDNNKNVRLSILCKYLDISSRTLQRWRKNGLTDKRKGASKNIPKKLSEEEVSTIYKLLCSNEYKEMTPVEAFNSLLDKGIYHASSRSFYRILKRFHALTHRTKTKSGTSRSKPAESKTFMTDQLFPG